MKYDTIIIGSGLAGSVTANLKANHNQKILLIEKRNHIGGNCYDFFNNDNILIHKYGPHIFHTSDKGVWDYLSKFTKWKVFKHRVETYVNKKLLPIPVNQDTINGYFEINLKTKNDVKNFLETKRDKKIKDIKNSKDVVISKYGIEIYNAFVKNYTKKQWDMYPEELDREVLERLPVRFDKNPYYFNDKYQGVPKYGYTKMIEKMIDNPNIHILLNTDYKDIINDLKYNQLYVSSPIDEFFNYKFGKLKYRCIDFRFKTINKESYQKTSIVNYPNNYKFTRITEMKKLTYQKSPKTTICKEYPTWRGEPSYPVPEPSQDILFAKYNEEAKRYKNIYFIGRLGTYKYLNMDQVINNTKKLIESSNE